MPRASRLEAELKNNLPVEVELIPGSGGIFEISLDGQMIFSKLASGRFADPEEIIGLIQSRG